LRILFKVIFGIETIQVIEADERNPRKYRVKIDGVPVQIHTEELPNIIPNSLPLDQHIR
jgi:hypothetical protein